MIGGSVRVITNREYSAPTSSSFGAAHDTIAGGTMRDDLSGAFACPRLEDVENAISGPSGSYHL